jgi:hypothetical protein
MLPRRSAAGEIGLDLGARTAAIDPDDVVAAGAQPGGQGETQSTLRAGDEDFRSVH